MCVFLFVSPQRGTEGFWKSVAHYVPRDPTEMRILNPYFIQEAAFQFIGLPLNNGQMGRGVRHTDTFTTSLFTRFLSMTSTPSEGTYKSLIRTAL